MSRLNERASSSRQEKRNQHSPSRAKILVFVESTADISFWHGILSPYENQIKMKFDISAYSGNDLTTGKDNLVKLSPKTGKNYLICLDSDYHYLLPESSDSAKQINQNLYIFQTYAYAMENLKCYAESLNVLCVRATNNTDETVNLSEFLKEYSQIIYPLLIWNIYYEHIDKYSDFSREKFGKIVTVDDIAPSNYREKLNIIQKSVSEKLQTFTNNDLFTEFSKQLSELGLNETNAYLFMNGHDLYDFIANFLVKICEELKNNHKVEIEELAKNLPEENRTKICKAKIGEYFKSLGSIRHLLAQNDKFTGCFLFKKIEKDIENYLELLKNSTSSK